MYPVAHATIAVAAVKAGERFLPARWQPLDYRFAAFGALLPDLIDKPLKWFLIPSLPDDHLWGHTFWLSAILIGAGLLLTLRRSDSRVLLVGFGALTHLIFDPVATDARTLFWPLFGSTFQQARGYWFDSPVPGPVIDALLIAALLIVTQAYYPARRRRSAFARSGAL